MGLIRTGSKCRHKIIIDKLDKVSRQRALSLQESLMLERAIEQEMEHELPNLRSPD